MIVSSTFSIFVPNIQVKAQSPTEWKSAGTLPTPLPSFAMAVHEGTVYIIGGEPFSANVYYAPILDDGTIGEWHPTTSLPEARSWGCRQGAVAYNNRIYVVGGAGPRPPDRIERNTVWYANINPDGSLGDWISTTSLPDHINNHITVAWNGRIYVIGGWTGYTSLNTVYYAEINVDGSLSSWSSTTSLPEPRLGRQAGAVHCGVIYQLGGEYPSGTLHNTVYYGEIDAVDGTVIGWSLTTSLPYEMGGHSVAVLGERIYLIGGHYYGSEVYLNDVYSAQINPDGSLGIWSEEPSLPEKRAHHASIAYNGRIYVFGGVNENGEPVDTIYMMTRTIEFSGYEWIVKSSNIRTGPDGNYFSDSNENVWVDEQGQLHLNITKGGDGNWYCAEVYTTQSFGYGKYIFYVASRVDQLDKNVVAGLFTWDDAPEYNHREIDIEFSRWGNETNDNSQYVVQPYDQPDNMKRFNMELTGDYSTHSFVWEPSTIIFQSLHGHYASPPDPSYIIRSWPYVGDDNPIPGNEKVHINLYLCDRNPKDGIGDKPSEKAKKENLEIIIKRFEYVSKWAVVMGVDEYTVPGATSMNGPANSATKFYNLLVNDFGFPPNHINKGKGVLADRIGSAGDDITTDVFFEMLDWLKSVAKPNDIVIFYYAGHGGSATKLTDVDPEYIVWHDFSCSDNDLSTEINKINSKSLIVILDISLAGGFIRDNGQLSDLALKDGNPADGRIVLTACGEVSDPGRDDTRDWPFIAFPWEKEMAFTHYLIQGFGTLGDYHGNNDGITSMEEAFNYAKGRFGIWPYTQQPQMYDAYQTYVANVDQLILGANAPASKSDSIRITAHSPVNILVTDPTGRRVGYDPVTDSVINEIPGATYSGIGSEPQTITIPSPLDGLYRVDAFGTASGEYNLQIDTLDSTGTLIDSITWKGTASKGDQDTYSAQLFVENGIIEIVTPPVGGFTMFANVFDILAPWIGLGLIALLTATIAIIATKKHKTVL
ncbi:MAG: caspase family protein [archaeon]|nr:caspase family protein [archaeon]